VTELIGVPAPAKVNLFLHVTGRRDDGYHLLQSVFALTDWCDRLDFHRRADGAVQRRDAAPGLLPDNDLCVQAARALQEATGCTQGVDITLDKRLPAEAGLGGGSSDAASTLLALNRLWQLNLTRRALMAIGVRLGADVPFFLGGHAAWVEGIGEQLTPLRLPPARLLIVKPPTGASTPRIFGSPDLKRDTKTAILQGFAANDTPDAPGHRPEADVARWRVTDLKPLLDWGHNDLQPVAQALCPDVGHCIRWLEGQGLQGRMSGSGTAVFAVWPEGRSDTTVPAPPSPGWIVRLCSMRDVHPLAGWASD
jgi:4-diphosphocytidyl-2-C-methyl-D-erythritol kinase